MMATNDTTTGGRPASVRSDVWVSAHWHKFVEGIGRVDYSDAVYPIPLDEPAIETSIRVRDSFLEHDLCYWIATRRANGSAGSRITSTMSRCVCPPNTPKAGHEDRVDDVCLYGACEPGSILMDIDVCDDHIGEMCESCASSIGRTSTSVGCFYCFMESVG